MDGFAGLGRIFRTEIFVCFSETSAFNFYVTSLGLESATIASFHDALSLTAVGRKFGLPTYFNVSSAGGGLDAVA